MKWKEKCIFAELEIASLKQTIAEQKITINALHHESETLCKQLAERDKEIEGLKKLSEDYKEGGSVEAEIVNELLEKGAKQKAALDIAREALRCAVTECKNQEGTICETCVYLGDCPFTQALTAIAELEKD